MTPEFLLHATVYLAAAVGSVPIARRLGLGSVLGYLIAGVLIGPFLLDLVGDATEVMHFAEFGVVMMLFLIGLELRPALLWRMRGPILGLGGLQVGVTLAGVAGVAMALGLGAPQALAVGMILALSSTAIVLSTLSERGTLASDAGQSSFAVLLFQDIAVIPMLAVLPLLAGTGGGTSGGGATGDGHGSTGGGAHGDHAFLIDLVPGWAQPLLVLGVVLAIVVAGRRLANPVLGWIARSGLREIFTAGALLLVVGVALLMVECGLSPALGSFLAGVVLADSEYRHALEADIEPFKGLLLGLFFTTVGASLDLGLVADRPLAIVGLVAGLMALKGVVLFGLGRAFRLRTSQALRFALALPQAGEFGFVLVAFGVQARLFDPELSGILLAVIAVSMFVTPLLFIVDERFVQPRFQARVREELDPERARAAVAEAEDQAVILAGLGRFGVTVLRYLKANGVNATVLELDPAQIELVGRFGHKGFFGDAARVDLLEAAGAREAKLLIVAIDDRDRANEIVRVAHEHFPQLKVLARARSMQHAYELMALGVDVVERETFGSALELGAEALRALGFRAHRAQRATRAFRHHERRVMDELAALVDDAGAYASHARLRSAELARLLAADDDSDDARVDDAFDVSDLIARFGGSDLGDAPEAERPD